MIQLSEKTKRYSDEIRNYLIGRLVPKKFNADLYKNYKLLLNDTPVLAWWVLEGKEYRGYSGPIYKDWKAIEKQIQVLLSTYNPKWQGGYFPEGEIDWVATAFRTVTNITPEFVCKTSKMGLSDNEKAALLGWMSWFSQLWSRYKQSFKIDEGPEYLFSEYFPFVSDHLEPSIRQVMRWATAAKRSRWPLLRNVVAESFRCVFEPVYIDKLPLPTSEYDIFELLCMVRILRRISPMPSMIKWVDLASGNNQCSIPEATFHYQFNFKLEDVLNSYEFSPELKQAISRQNVRVPKILDGYLELREPIRGFVGILVEAKSGNNRNFGETVYQLKTYLSAIRKEESGRLLILGIIEDNDDHIPNNSHYELLKEKVDGSSNDVWFFLSAGEIERVVEIALYNDLERFEVHSGGYMGSSFSVEKDGDVLIFKSYESGYSLKKTQNIKPSLKEWEIFFNDCDQIGIWEWHSRYVEPGILDGSSWRVIIEKGDKQLDSSGSNKGPDKLNLLFKSLSVLLGGIDFY